MPTFSIHDLGRMLSRPSHSRAVVSWVCWALDDGAQRVDILLSRNADGLVTAVEIVDDAPLSEERRRRLEPESALFDVPGDATLPASFASDLPRQLCVELLPWLSSHPDVVVTCDGTRVDPVADVDSDHTEHIEWHDGTTCHHATLRIVIWTAAHGRSLRLCREGTTQLTPLDGAPGTGLPYAAYVTWHHHTPQGQPDAVAGLARRVSRAVTDHVETVMEDRRRTLVQSAPVPVAATLLHTSVEQSSAADLARQVGERMRDRLILLDTLERVLFIANGSARIGEVKHLHPLVAQHSWLFGDEFNHMRSEISLTTLLIHVRKMRDKGRPNITPVTRLDGSSGRVDLVLSWSDHHPAGPRHLVVELKAPSVTAGREEAHQIKSYARAVSTHSQFKNTACAWDFMLVVNDYDKDLALDINQPHRTPGLLDETPTHREASTHCRVWVRTWAEILQQARARHRVHCEALQHRTTEEDIRDCLRQYRDVLPAAWFEDDALGLTASARH